MIEVKKIEERDNGVCLFEIKNEQLRVIVSNLGCHVLSVFTKDRDGNFGDVVLGFENVEDCHHDGSYMGAIVGRVANRIGNAGFELNGKTYKLAANAGPNSHHGGLVGFNQKLFNYEVIKDGIRFIYLSPDMEEGYPGSLYLKVSYLLCDNTLKMKYEAVSDQDTLINITNHSYFNLSAGQDKIYHHEMKIKADEIACGDENCLANGTFLNVENTPFDFKEFHEIGERINDDHEQLKLAGGYDHSFMVKDEDDQLVLYDKETGRKMTMTTTLPCIQPM